jgi:hypothetical protein
MSMIRFSVSLVAIMGAIAATIAAATIWLLLTDPIQSAHAADELVHGKRRAIHGGGRIGDLRRAPRVVQVSVDRRRRPSAAATPAG